MGTREILGMVERFYNCINLLKLTKLYTGTGYILWYANFCSIKQTRISSDISREANPEAFMVVGSFDRFAFRE